LSTRTIEAVPLTAAAFRLYGDVVEAGERFDVINRGTTRQYADLARLDVDAQGGRARLSLYRVAPYAMPLAVTMLERHPLSSQLFVPLNEARFLVVVAAPGVDAIDPSQVRAFLCNGRQGVNYRPGTWHHPVIALDRETDFLVLDRSGGGRNCDEFHFDPAAGIVVELPAR
jgi:ureidoglycolate lyase